MAKAYNAKRKAASRYLFSSLLSAKRACATRYAQTVLGLIARLLRDSVIMRVNNLLSTMVFYFAFRRRHFSLATKEKRSKKKGRPALSYFLVTQRQARLRNSLRSNSAWLNRLALA
ncbi:hypothetical protein [Agarivorans litoreus]|uniref:hypothetical protein n=1 Tax=Agarivorans litoreus TaxID=1510455 RepID=UPI001C7CCD50|nr:hypothetical protein [Agarivorans litoreus]